MANRKERDKKKARMASAREWADKQAQGGPSHLKMGDVERYKLEIGKHDIDFMPFLAGKNNPSGDEGFGVFTRRYVAHRIPGLDGKPRLVICRSEFGKPCPACKIRNSGNSAIAEALKPTTRGLWLVNETPGKKPKWKVLDIYHYNRGMGFGELMQDAIQALKDEDINPFDLENGLTATLTVKEQSMPGNKFNAVTRIDFNSRDEQYDSGLLDKAPCLDEMLVDVGEEEMKRLISQGDTDDVDSDDDDDKQKKSKKRDRDEEDDEDEDDDDDTPRTKSGAKKDSEDEDMESTADDHGLEKGDLVMYRGEECEIKKISKDGTSLTLEDEDGDEITAVDPSKCKKIENPKDDEDDSELEPKKKAKKKKAVKDEDDDEDEDSELEPDEDDSELESKKKGKKKAASDEDDDDDDSELEPDDDDEDEPKAKKKGKGKKKVDEDDDDDED